MRAVKVGVDACVGVSDGVSDGVNKDVKKHRHLPGSWAGSPQSPVLCRISKVESRSSQVRLILAGYNLFKWAYLIVGGKMAEWLTR